MFSFFFSPFNGSHDEEVVIHPVAFFPLIMSSWKGVDQEGWGANGDIL